MNVKQAIKAMRELHRGGYYERADWRVSINKRCAVRQADRDAARERMRELRAVDNFVGVPLRTPEWKELQSVALSYRVSVGHVVTSPMQFFVIDGQGDTIADAVADAVAKVERDRARYRAEGKKVRK